MFLFTAKDNVTDGFMCAPDTLAQQYVKAAIANPDARDVVNNTIDIEAPTPVPAADAHTINTYTNDAKNSHPIDLKKKGKKISQMLIQKTLLSLKT